MGVGVPVADSTTTVPAMNPCWPQTNSYVPGAIKRHVPAQPGGDGSAGSGGTGPMSSPTVCVHSGCSPPKSTLWLLLPSG